MVVKADIQELKIPNSSLVLTVEINRFPNKLFFADMPFIDFEICVDGTHHRRYCPEGKKSSGLENADPRYIGAALHVLKEMRHYTENSPLFHTKKGLAGRIKEHSVYDNRIKFTAICPNGTPRLLKDLYRTTHKEALFEALCAKAQEVAESPEVAAILERDGKSPAARDAERREREASERRYDYSRYFTETIAATSKKEACRTLGVLENTPWEEVKTAYRQLALKHHPDRNPGDSEAEKRFTEVQKAYDVLEKIKEKAIGK